MRSERLIKSPWLYRGPKKKHVYIDLSSGSSKRTVQRSNKVYMYRSNHDSNACVFGKNVVAGNSRDALDKIDMGDERKIFRHEQNFDLSDEDDGFVIPGEIFDNKCKSVPADDGIRDSKLTLTRTMMKTVRSCGTMSRSLERKDIGPGKKDSRKKYNFFLWADPPYTDRAREVVQELKAKVRVKDDQLERAIAELRFVEKKY
ncbi:hypothetical protein AgCh_003704 [Apium graveolens]